MKQHKYKKGLALLLALALMLVSFAGFTQAAKETSVAKDAPETQAGGGQGADSYTAGTYEGTAMGHNGEIKLSVDVSDSEITGITILEHKESAGISDLALSQIPEMIVQHQSLAVDTVTGATKSSEGVLAAAEEALSQAGADIDELKNRTIEVTAGEAMDLSADVIVVGGGGAGMSAAISAAENGASVIVIEKGDMLGGNTRISGGAWNAVDPELLSKTPTEAGQLETLEGFLEEDPADYPEGYAETLEELQQEIQEYLSGDTTYMFDSVNLHIIQCYQGGLRQDLDGEWIYGVFEMVKTLCENSLDTYHCIQDNWGMVWNDELTTVYGGLWKRGHYSTYVKGNGFFEMGQPYAESMGVEFILATEAKSLIQEDGTVVGVNAEKTDGTQVTLHANMGVVIATGGYGGSPELVKEYNNYWPELPEELTTNNVATTVGDGIFMCQEVGADLVGMEFVQLMALSHPVTNTNTGMSSPPEYTLYVNQEGERFVNEYAARDVIAEAAFAQTDGMFYSIEDQAVAEIRYSQEDIDGWLEEGFIWTGETLEDLAEEIGIDPKVLVNTVETYNSYVDNGSDPDFHKDVLAGKIEVGPFYATPHKPNVHHTMGGVKINTDTQVLDTNGDVIPGLYAAGEVTGGIHAGNRLGGNAVADAVIFGRIAGASATKGAAQAQADLSQSQKSDGSNYIPGTYTATKYGMNGNITVTITVDENAILSVDAQGDAESPGIGLPVVEEMPAMILEAQSAEIDVVSGASVTSKALLAAAADCIAQASGTAVTAADEAAQNYEADVIVVGAGGAGLAAAAGAGEAGASVIVLEASGRTGGATSLSGGHMTIIHEEMNAALERNDEVLEKYLSYDPADFGEWGDTLVTLQEQIRAYMESDSTGRFDSVELALIDVYLTGSGTDRDGVPVTLDFEVCKAALEANMDLFNWLTDAGMEISDEFYKTRANTPEGKGVGLTDTLLKRAEDANAEIVYNTRGIELVMEDGKAVGVVAITSDGQRVTYTARRGVVLATGGFASNGEMCAEYQNMALGLTADNGSTNPETNVGDGILMAEEVGAELRDMQFLTTMASEYGEFSGTQQLVVNAVGLRYGDENSGAFSTLTNDQPGATAYLVGDAKMHQALTEDGLLDDLVERGLCYVGDTLEDAAEMAGLDADVLAGTVEQFNGYADAGADPDFGRTDFSGKVEEGPYVIGKAQAYYHLTFGGLVVDADSHVYSTEGNIIPGLYAAGDIISGFEGAVHQSGNCLLVVVNGGRVAGANAYNEK